MGLKIAVLKETADHEKRVAASPETVKKLTSLGCVVTIEAGAGAGASITDQAFKDAGAKIATSADAACKGANIMLLVQAPTASELGHIKAVKGKETLLLGLLNPYAKSLEPDDYAKNNVNAFSMEMVPRISRAQSMDVLSSQSNLAGYKAVLDASAEYTSAFPMMMTAAGTVPPAKVFVMGAGVAGLQAIATAKRLGAVVSATDVRPAAKEQVESLGASFVAVEDDEFKEAETAGGYAKEMSKAYQKKQAELVANHIAKQDIVITTALIPGRPAPKLITEAMVKSMKPGSVIVDLAVENGGNCALSKAGKVVEVGDVKIVGHHNVPSRLARDASALYAKNLFNLLVLIIDKETGKLSIDWEDEIIKGVALTKDGEVIHPNFVKKAAPKKTADSVSAAAPVKKVAAKKASAKKSPAKKTTAKKPTAKKAATSSKG